ncbi:hypothetical protein B0J17DRAFT_87062 [Rhizoctonia solani]|nr:hypothetical protein B0J17DRAFT_87062 [Rhizoctonia solani]
MTSMLCKFWVPIRLLWCSLFFWPRIICSDPSYSTPEIAYHYVSLLPMGFMYAGSVLTFTSSPSRSIQFGSTLPAKYTHSTNTTRTLSHPPYLSYPP